MVNSFVAVLLFLQVSYNIVSWYDLFFLLVFELHDVPIDEIVELIVELFYHCTNLVIFFD